MKKLVFLLMVIPMMVFTQTPDSWVQFVVQYDFYAPQESNFFMVEDTISGDTVMFHQPTDPYEYLDTVIPVNSGDYVVTLTDSYGDGWLSQNPAWFKMQNDCQGQILNYDPLTMAFFTLDTLVSIWPCAPPTPGCTDSNALNYDPTATVDDGSCIFPPCSGLSFFNSYTSCDGGQAEIVWQWQTTSSSPNCDVIGIHIQNGGYPLLWNDYWQAGVLHEFTTMAGQGQQAPGWSSNYTAVLEYTDGSFSDTIFQTAIACVPGCMDPTSVSFNPWATFDNGLCAGAACPADENDITLQITLDNWPTETGWYITSGTDTVGSVPEGTYDFNDIGETYVYNFCIDTTNTFEFTVTDQYGDGLAGSTSGGTIDGQITIYDCNGDTIWYLQNPAFGTIFTEDSLTSISCGSAITIDGCMDQAYQEYDSLANNNLQYLCLTLHVQGCTDQTAFNYDPNATINQIVPFGDYILTIEDDGGDGWLNSYIGVEQNGLLLGTYTMVSGSYSQSFPLNNISTATPINVYYFEIKNQQTNPQELQFQTMHNSFTIADSSGNILMEEGTNPFANNGQGALQSFDSPNWIIYSALPFFGDYCIEAAFGCMDPLSFNYDGLANTDDGSCIPITLGCTNDLAFNYDSLANTDDGSCVAEVIGCMDSTAFNYNSSANTNDQLSCIPVILGCMDDTMYNYNAAANTDDGNCIPFIFGCTDVAAFNFNSNANTNNGSCIPIVLGCTDNAQWNYDPAANTDDGSCLPYIFGCTDVTAFNYDPAANTNNGSCVPIINGCIDQTQFNYNPLANTDNGSCIPFLFGCMDLLSFNYDPLANTDNGSCDPFIYGCTDSTALNYNPLANTDDLTCIDVLLGCTDSTAINYNALANTDDGSCIDVVLGCMDINSFNYDPIANTDDGSCIPVILGCIDPTQFNYDPLANTDNGSCIAYSYGCMDILAFNYNPLANTDNGSCIDKILGCMDSTALNFDPIANTEYIPSNCILPIAGCTDVAAYNYDPLANTSDSTSCLFEAVGCVTGLGAPFGSGYWLNDGCFAWVIDVDNYCCTNEWDVSCQSMYDYCQNGWPTSIEDASSMGIMVYPNPTGNILNIDTRLDVEVEIYDMTGRLMIKDKSKRIDLSNYGNGVYNLILIYNNKRFTTRVVKQ